jgi:23S rRNA (cytidine1920-2'-O)/16S rRNA (cytidine1409-2'-O)-methyltransferase
MIAAGQVYVNGIQAAKPSEEAGEDDALEIRGEALRWVSRGGLKLEKALAAFGISLDGAVCVDVGASTGGFTDCMLANGAAKVYAVDSGVGQLAEKLRTDSRVISMERTNIRYLTAEQLPDVIDFAGVDVSFISLTMVLPALSLLLRDGGEAVCLVKPQFEAGRGKVGKNGVVRDKATHRAVAMKLLGAAAESGFAARHFDYSPIKGPSGNIEYLLQLKKTGGRETLSADIIARVVDAAHKELSA